MRKLIFGLKPTYFSRCLLVAATISTTTLSTSTYAETETDLPKLVLQITVDGLRGDLLERYKAHFGSGGFRYLMDEGVYYTNANYQHANTETIVGHVSLATGAPPSAHGMVGNVWFDRSLDRLVYNVEDPNYHMLNSAAGVDKSTEIDPTQKAAAQDGRSPEPILATTFSDELTIASNGQSGVFSVSVKDRGAISLAGHSGKAFWFSKSSSEFVTSNYYYDATPFWVTHWNEKALAKSYSGQSWQLSLPQEKYLQPASGASYKVDLGGFARTFPHPYGPASYKYYSTMLTVSPAGDEITADFAHTLLGQLKLGKGEHTDYLAVSFSSNDYVIHLYGPESLEAEDNLVRLDRTLEKLFQKVDQSVGLNNTLIVLSADHGVPESAPAMQQLGFKQSQYFNKQTLMNDDLFAMLEARFALPKEVIKLYAQPYIYLDRELIANKKLVLSEVQNAIAEQLLTVPGVETAVTSESLQAGQFANTRVNQLVANNFHPTRSGDIHIVFTPRTYINDMDGLTIASTHGSPWRYDTHVPVIFAGHKIRAKQISRDMTPYDIAPTLSSYLGINLPSAATGQPLSEVLRQQH